MKKSTKRRIILAVVAALLLAAVLVLTLTDIVPDPEPLTDEEVLLVVLFLLGPHVLSFLFDVVFYRLRLRHVLNKLKTQPDEDSCLWFVMLLTEWWGLGRWIWLRGKYKTRFCERVETLYREKVLPAGEEEKPKWMLYKSMKRIGLELPQPE